MIATMALDQQEDITEININQPKGIKTTIMERKFNVTEEFAEQFKAVFGRIYDEVYSHSDGDKHSDIVFTIIDNFKAIAEFAGVNNAWIVYTAKKIKEKFIGSYDEKNIADFCDSVLFLMVEANRHFDTSSKIASVIDGLDSAIQDMDDDKYKLLELFKKEN